MEHSSEKPSRSEQWSADKSRKIIYRAVATGQLVLETPAHFGAGEQDGISLVILQDALEGLPLLPGASQAGAFRHYLLRREKGYRTADDSTKDTKTCATLLFGEALDEDQYRQSRVITYDVYGTSSGLGIRDGVKIDGATRSADDGALFNVQVWPKGTTFCLQIELYICEEDDSDSLKRAFAALLQALQKSEIPLGARKNRGYGRCKVAAWEVYEYNFNRQEDFLAWVLQKPTANTAEDFLKWAAEFTDERQRVQLEATFSLCDSLMIRAGAELVDNTSLSDLNGHAVLSGTSLTGALRARALKIIKSFKNDKDTVEFVDDMFGKHGSTNDNDDENMKMAASRLHVQEQIVQNPHPHNFIQNRVKIDRFTGGAYETALMSEQPVFATPQTHVTIKLELQYPANQSERHKVRQQTGLLLLLLKDLWTEDLPLGGESSIGRGRLKGLDATLTLPNGTCCKFDSKGLENPNQANKLQCYLNILWGEK